MSCALELKEGQIVINRTLSLYSTCKVKLTINIKTVHE
jgi:hypothetical protein